jgi:hypothetical protein
MGGIGLYYDLQQPRYSLSIIMDSNHNFLELKWPGHGEPIVKVMSFICASVINHDITKVMGH